jgi:hypothetical protein
LLLAIRRIDLCSAGFVGPLSYSSDGRFVSLVRIKERNPVLQGQERKAFPARRRHSKKELPLPMVRSPIDESLESERKEEEFKILYLVQYAIECCGTEPDFTRLRKNVG